MSIPCPAVALGDHQQTSLPYAASLARASGAVYQSSVVTGPMGVRGGRGQGLDPKAAVPRFPKWQPLGGPQRNRSIATGKSRRLSNALCQVNLLIKEELKAFKLPSCP